MTTIHYTYKESPPEFLSDIISDQMDFYHQKIKDYTLFDDFLMKRTFGKNPNLIPFIIGICLGKELRVKEVSQEKQLVELSKKSVIIDGYCIDQDDTYYVLEVQKNRVQTGLAKICHDIALVRTHLIQKNTKPEHAPKVIGIVITPKDAQRLGLEKAHIKRTVQETGTVIDDGEMILILNASNPSDTPQGRLLKDMKESDPKNIYYEIIKNAVEEEKHDMTEEEYLRAIYPSFALEGEERGIAIGEERGIAIGEGKEKIKVMEILKEGIRKGLRLEDVYQVLSEGCQ